MTQALSHAVFAESAGARWRRVDLHLHSPLAPDFRLPSGWNSTTAGERQRIAQAYVERLQAADIEVAALTDYNRIDADWYGPLRARAEEAGIALLPGVELSLRAGKHGLHVLAIFSAGTDLDAVNHAVRGMCRDASQPVVDADGRPTRLDIRGAEVDCLRDLRERFGCLVIPAHPGLDNGLLKTYQPAQAARFLQEVRVDAIERIDPRDLQRLGSSGAVDGDVLDSLALVEFSDPKALDEVGTKLREPGRTPRATYLMLSDATPDALRLALHDPVVRVHLGDRPPAPSHPRIAGLTVEGGGFLGSLAVRFNDDLTTLIGARGTGKSAVLEVLRYALDLPVLADATGRAGLVEHALGSGGRVEVVLERPVVRGNVQRFTVSRVLHEAPLVRGASGATVALDPGDALGDRAGPMVFGQRELQAVADSERLRRDLLDEVIGDDARQAQRAVVRAADELRRNARKLLEAAAALAERDDVQQQLARARAEIEVYEQEGVAEKLRLHTALVEDRAALQDALRRVVAGGQEWDEATGRIAESLHGAPARLHTRETRQPETINAAVASVQKLLEQLREATAAGQAAFAAARDELDVVLDSWDDVLAPYEQELLRLKRVLDSERLSPDRLIELTRQRATLEPLADELAAVARRTQSLADERRDLIAGLREARRAAFTLRRERCDAITQRLEGRLRVTAGFKEDVEPYRDALLRLLRGSGLNTTAVGLLAEQRGSDGAAVVAAARAGPECVEEEFGITPAMAQRLVEWLTDDQRRFELELAAPGDSIRVELRREPGYRELQRLSLGQRATAMLLLVFAFEGRPLLLDQPEDDLDNAFVYNDVVALIRAAKNRDGKGSRRQLIVATHNANIPVLGDAELVLPLAVREGRACIESRASIDHPDTRDAVRTVLEGGEEAFRRRAEKYGTT